VNRIEARFEQLAQRGEVAFIPYIVAGDPDLSTTEKIVIELERAGSDVIELGIPFSDPVADGIPNQEGAQRALKYNVSLREIVGSVKRIRKVSQVPILLMTYYNPVMAYGHEAFASDASDAGVDGVLCVDLPPEEAGDYKRALDARGISTVFLIAPTSTDDRIELIAKSCTGFIYYVSRTGVTGERDQLERSVRPTVEKIRAHTNKPIAVGFGISNPDHAREVAAYADGVVVGSAIVRLIGEAGAQPGGVAKVGAFVESLVKATKERRAPARAR
jgi:tryptophan synthase alpha chain